MIVWDGKGGAQTGFEVTEEPETHEQVVTISKYNRTNANQQESTDTDKGHREEWLFFEYEDGTMVEDACVQWTGGEDDPALCITKHYTNSMGALYWPEENLDGAGREFQIVDKKGKTYKLTKYSKYEGDYIVKYTFIVK